MFKVTLDTKALSSQLGKKAGPVISAALNALETYATDRMRQMSSEHLRIETQKTYVDSLEIKRTKNSITFSLSDPAMIALETGYTSFDMKPGLLKSRKAKRGKSGRYIDVPFAQRTTKRGKGTYIAPASMRAAVKKAQKSLDEGEVERMFPAQKGEPRTIHTDMRVTRETAHTFRRVSGNSPADKWIHPGIEGIGVFEKVAQEVEEIKDKVVQDIASGMGS